MLVLLGLLCGGGVDAAERCRHLMATGNPEYPPYLWRSPQNPDRLVGANADLLEEIGKQLGIQIDVVYSGPWSRAQEEARTGHVDLIAGAFLTVPRLGAMDYVHPAFYTTANVVWVNKKQRFDYRGWGDLHGRRGATLVNNSFGQEFDAFARQDLSIEGVASVTQAFRMLSLGRADYVLYELYPGLAVAETLDMEDDVEPLDPPVSSEALFLTLSHASPCNEPWLRGQLAIKMTELTAAGLPQTLLKRNLERWKAQQPAAGAPPSK
jgi:polar amino acid transport system substrate-binding protein